MSTSSSCLVFSHFFGIAYVGECDVDGIRKNPKKQKSQSTPRELASKPNEKLGLLARGGNGLYRLAGSNVLNNELFVIVCDLPGPSASDQFAHFAVGMFDENLATVLGGFSHPFFKSNCISEHFGHALALLIGELFERSVSALTKADI
jgi:hypothetical protein